MTDLKPWYDHRRARQPGQIRDNSWFALCGVSFVTGCLLGATLALFFVGGAP